MGGHAPFFPKLSPHIKTDAHPLGIPPLKNEAPQSEKQPPHEKHALLPPLWETLISNVNVMKAGLEILLLVFRISRILIETGLRLNFSQFVSHLFLNLKNTLHDAWIVS